MTELNQRQCILVIDGKVSDKSPTWFDKVTALRQERATHGPGLVVAINHSGEALKIANHRNLPAILVGLEPPCVEPAHCVGVASKLYQAAVLAREPSSSELRKTRSGSVLWSTFPVPMSHRLALTKRTHRLPLEDRIFSITLVAGNKASLAWSEQYSLRRRVMAKMTRERVPFTLVGRNWSRKDNLREVTLATLGYLSRTIRTFPHSDWKMLGHLSLLASQDHWTSIASEHYEGPIDNIIDAYTGNFFALVIENDSTFASEKAFDALDAGCYVFYIGPRSAPFPLGSVEILPEDVDEAVRRIQQVLSSPLDSIERIRQVRLDCYRSWLTGPQAMSKEFAIGERLNEAVRAGADRRSRLTF